MYHTCFFLSKQDVRKTRFFSLFPVFPQITERKCVPRTAALSQISHGTHSCRIECLLRSDQTSSAKKQEILCSTISPAVVILFSCLFSCNLFYRFVWLESSVPVLFIKDFSPTWCNYSFINHVALFWQDLFSFILFSLNGFSMYRIRKAFASLLRSFLLYQPVFSELVLKSLPLSVTFLISVSDRFADVPDIFWFSDRFGSFPSVFLFQIIRLS